MPLLSHNEKLSKNPITNPLDVNVIRVLVPAKVFPPDKAEPTCKISSPASMVLSPLGLAKTTQPFDHTLPPVQPVPLVLGQIETLLLRFMASLLANAKVEAKLLLCAVNKLSCTNAL